MRKFFYLLLISSGFGQLTANAQQSYPEQDCINAIPVCQSLYSQNVAYSGVGADTELTTINQGCLSSGEKNDVWYVINVTSPGLLAFNITPNLLSEDYDFAVWDITGVGCSAIFNYTTNTPNALQPVGYNAGVGCPAGGGASNYSPTPGVTGLAISGANNSTGGPVSPAFNVVAGQTLVLNVSHFTNGTTNGYTLDFSPSTASIFDTVKPTFLNVTTKCQFTSDTLIVRMSEPVKCSSIAANGSDFYITPATGVNVVSAVGTACGGSVNSATNVINLGLSSIPPPGTYWLHANTGTDNNTLLDNCGNMQALTDSIQFVLVDGNPPQMVSVDTPACTKARIHFDRGVKCSTIAADGSDFVITGPGAVGITNAVPIGCSSVGLSDTVDVFFDASIFTPGTYTLSLKDGTDGNAITDTCGLIVNNTVSFTVTDGGSVYTTITPSVICAPGYVQLDTLAVTTIPPLATLSCGVNGTVCSGTATDHAVGDAAAVGLPANTPFSGTYTDGRTQLLYRASELRSAGLGNGTITQLGFNVTSKLSTLPYSNLTIKMGCTTDTALTTFKYGLPIVYSPKTYSTVAGANTFPLDQTYDWDGVSNIIVELCYHNTTASQSDVLQTTAGLFNGAALHNQQFSSDGCALGDPNPIPAGIRRANITFSECGPPRAPQMYLWTPSHDVQDSTSPNTLAYVQQNSTFQLQIKDSNACYRRTSSSVAISVRNPQLLTNDTALCIGASHQIVAAGGLTYTFFPTEGLSCTDCPDPIATPTQTTTYYVSIADQYGCADTLKQTVVVNPLPVVDAGPDTSIVYGTSVPLYVNVPSAKFFLWEPPTWLNLPTASNPVATPQISTTYTVFVTDTNQCRGQDSIHINVIRDIPVFLPTAFMPGGATNNIFHLINLTFQRVQEFRVFNRWGQEVFSAQDNHGWDGTFNGVAQDIGVYNYLIRVAYPDGRVQTFHGDVTLIR